LLILYYLNQAAKFLKYTQIIRLLCLFFLIAGLKIKKYQILGESVAICSNNQVLILKCSALEAKFNATG